MQIFGRKGTGFSIFSQMIPWDRGWEDLGFGTVQPSPHGQQVPTGIDVNKNSINNAKEQARN